MKKFIRRSTEQKFNPFFSLLILLAMVFTACHQDSIKLVEYTANDQIAASSRSCIQDCTDCSAIGGECCCVIAIDLTTNPFAVANLEICSRGLANCSIGDCVGEPNSMICNTFAGSRDTITLNLNNRGYFFCQPNGEPLRIINTGADLVTLELLCNPDTPPPPTIQFSLNPQDTIYLFVDGSNCEPDFCN